MKKLIALSLISLAASASAATWFYNGTLYGNICRNGPYYTVYSPSQGQPVGSSCPLRDVYGNVIGQGFVSNE